MMAQCKVELLEETPLTVASFATRTCWASYGRSDSDGCSLGEKDRELLLRVGKKFKHRSILEHLNIFVKIPEDYNSEIVDWLKQNQYSFFKNNICVLNARLILENMYFLQDVIYDLLGQSEIVDLIVSYKIHDQFPDYRIYENGIIIKFKNSKEKDYTKIPKRMKTYIDCYGYPAVKLRDIDGKSKCKTIHRLIGELFVDNKDPENKTQINHIDGNKLNNELDNLEWVTQSENEQHSYDVLSKVPYNKGKKLPDGYEYRGTIRKVGQYDTQGNLIKEWFNPTIAEKEGGFIAKQISACALGRQKTHKGFIWKYQENKDQNDS